jgi:nitroimidazol reductase NimA-like FMN-containing flavoprotein (pyridoxamine 5'-phosphate oxidase superfamily)
MRVTNEGDAREQAWLEELPLEACLSHLRHEAVGRLAVVMDGRPLVFPVNYRLVETVGLRWIAMRTRPDGVIDRATMQVAFEIDSIDPGHHQGWSVLVRGTMQPVDRDAAEFRERFDSEPWLDERDAWYAIEPFSITGRQLHAAAPEWAFSVGAYL